MLDPTVTLNCDLTTSIRDMFIVVQKCTYAESLEKACSIAYFLKILCEQKNYCVNNLWDAQTDIQTDRRKDSRTGRIRGRRHKKVEKSLLLHVVQP